MSGINSCHMNSNGILVNHPLLVYVASIGHSGSTLLDILMGSIKDVFSCGELRYFPWQLYHGRIKAASRENQNICTCLKEFPNCPVWGRVAELVSLATHIDMKSDPLDFKICYMRPNYFTRQLPVVQSRMRNQAYRYLLQDNHVKKLIFKSNRKITENNWLLLDAISKVTGSKVIVDSTKDPLRYLMLAENRATKLIVLIRNPYGLAWSYIKRGMDPEETIRIWVKYYTKIQKAIESRTDINKCLIVKYEDLCRDTEKVLSNIAFYLGKDYEGLKEIDTGNYHLVAGNPMRYYGKINVRVDSEWESKLGANNRKMIKSIRQT